VQRPALVAHSRIWQALEVLFTPTELPALCAGGFDSTPSMHLNSKHAAGDASQLMTQHLNATHSLQGVVQAVLLQRSQEPFIQGDLQALFEKVCAECGQPNLINKIKLTDSSGGTPWEAPGNVAPLPHNTCNCSNSRPLTEYAPLKIKVRHFDDTISWWLLDARDARRLFASIPARIASCSLKAAAETIPSHAGHDSQLLSIGSEMTAMIECLLQGGLAINTHVRLDSISQS
jgi:hypothetical protein